jgi:hypothetical protein
MAFKIGYADGHKNLLIAVKGFLCNAKKAYNIEAGANTGDGYVSAERASTAPVNETWTLTATSATNFTVTGSVSGAQAAATVGTPYDNGIVAFTIVAGDTAFVATDSFTFDVADGLGATEVYTATRYDTDYDGAGGYELILTGPGTAGDDEILTAIQTVQSAGDDFYNWRIAGMTAYSDVDLQYMPGRTKGRLPRLLLWQNKIKYWIVANGRRFVLSTKVSTTYPPCYLGFALPYGLPTQFPYPMVVGGAACPDTTAAYNRYSSTHASNRGFANPYADAAAVCTASAFDTTGDYASLKILHGTSWIKIFGKTGSALQGTNVVWPYCSSHINAGYGAINTLSLYLRENIDGSYPIFNAVPMISNPSNHIVGPLQGVFAMPGFGGIAAEDTFSINGDTYVAFPIVPNADRGDFWALKLE